MYGISHRTVEVNGIKMHVAEKGDADSPVVLFIHGFPVLWYSWRHQIHAIAARGYRAVAPDLRGYGDTESPTDPASFTVFHIFGDLVALIAVQKVFVVGQDWGAIIAWHLCLVRPDLVKALVNMSGPFIPRNPNHKPVESVQATYGDDYYVCRLQKPGEMEELFAKLGTKHVLKKFFTYRKPSPFYISNELGDSMTTDIALPSWLSEDDLDYLASKFEKTGFTGGINYYRCMDLNWELSAAWTGVQIKVPVKFIVGDLDLVYHFPGIQDYIHKGGFKSVVPLLEEVVVMEGVGHFINQEKPSEITQHIHDYISKF